MASMLSAAPHLLPLPVQPSRRRLRGPSSIALAALLALPALAGASQCAAQVPPAAAMAQSSAQAPTQAAIAQWRLLTATPRPAMEETARFLIANPGWPNESDLRRAVETGALPSGYVPASIAAFFERYPPTSASGHLRHAMALNAAGRRADALLAARRAWTGGPLSIEEETSFAAAFPGAMTVADHDQRMDRLLWNGATTAAARQLYAVSPARRSEFTARLAMRQRDTSAAMRAAAAEAETPALVRANAGYIADKVGWLSATGQGAAARALLSGPRALAVPPLEPEKWLELLLAQGRAALDAGAPQAAYDIARKVDDALPLGAAILEQPIGVRDDYTSLVWLAASTAQNQLRRPREAAGLYTLYAAGGRSPQVQARGLYWAGRAAAAAGEPALATDYLTRAARHYDQFHGQLALERLGVAQPRPTPPGQLSFSQAQRNAFEGSSLVRAARLLGQQGQWRDQSLFLRAIATNARSDADHYFATQLANELRRPDLGVMVGRSARINGLDDYAPSAFPTVVVPAGYEGDWTFIHAISRQESQFDRQAMSRVGARGLMQLMPGTAREQAGKLGLNYDLAALTDDPRYNIMLGSSYFRRMLAYYGGSYPLAVAAYNAGPGNVNRWLASNGDPRSGADVLQWIEAIPLSETRGYVQRVLENAVVYETIRPGAPQGQRNLLSRYLGKSTPG